MATIFGQTVTFALPENDDREQQVSVGEAWDGTYQFYKYGSSRRNIVIPLRGLTTSAKNSLLTALEGDANYQGTIAPDSHVDLGAGTGTSITAQWVPPFYTATKDKHERWNLVLYFRRVS